MPAVVNNWNCQECGRQHTLCLISSDMLVPGDEYEYECPSVKRTVRFTASDEWNLVAPRPTGAVIIQPTGGHHRR
jgi:hypothetical protein